MGAALLTTGSLAILEAVFAPADRGKAIGAWSGLSGVAGAIGPFLGGWLVLGGGLLAGFIAWERGAATPILPLHLFTSTRFSATNLVTFTIRNGRRAPASPSGQPTTTGDSLVH